MKVSINIFMKALKNRFTLLFVFVSIASIAQPPDMFFVKFGGIGKDIGYSTREIYNRQYIIAGSTTSYGKGVSDAYIILIDSMGQAKWEKTVGGQLADIAKCIVFNPIDSGFVFSGWTASFGNGGYDIYVVRIDKNGDVLWEKTFGTENWEFGNDCILAPDGNILVAATVDGDSASTDGLVMKIDINSGNEIWSRYIRGNDDDELTRLTLNKKGNLLVAGNTRSFGDKNSDFLFYEIEQNTGDSIRCVTVGHSNKAETMYDFIFDKYNRIVLCGTYDTSVANTGKNVSYIYIVDTNFNFITDAYYGNFGSNEKFRSIASQTTFDDFVLARTIYSSSTALNLQLLKLWYNGLSYLDAKDHGDQLNDEGYKIISTSDHGFAVAGYRTNENTRDEDLYFLKIDEQLSFAPQVLFTNESFKIEARKIYFFENELFFDNPKRDLLFYTVYNSEGRISLQGATSNNKIKIESDISPGLYVFYVSGKSPQKLKFLVTKN